ncbi:MAG: DUF5082 family protein [Acutalibacteraceae bacterium]|nr:DUF5082 family protein [Acutalibacteraceae bacterium]
MSNENQIDWARYNSLTSQKNSAETQMSEVQSQTQQLNNQIKRLKSAKSIVETEKENFKAIKKGISNIVDDDYEWKGDTYDKFKNYGSYLNEDHSNYYDSIDMVLDSINNKITELENQIYRNDGILGELRSWWNSLCNSIENLFN